MRRDIPQTRKPFFLSTLTYHILDAALEAESYETPCAGRLIKTRAAISLPLKNSGEECHNSGFLKATSLSEWPRRWASLSL